jgi:hypothetical protein
MQVSLFVRDSLYDTTVNLDLVGSTDWLQEGNERLEDGGI